PVVAEHLPLKKKDKGASRIKPHPSRGPGYLLLKEKDKGASRVKPHPPFGHLLLKEKGNGASLVDLGSEELPTNGAHRCFGIAST
ncbi:MAG: hypothetical protein ACXVLT_14430, partial [Flavisolibacter sp.]